MNRGASELAGPITVGLSTERPHHPHPVALDVDGFLARDRDRLPRQCPATSSFLLHRGYPSTSRSMAPWLIATTPRCRITPPDAYGPGESPRKATPGAQRASWTTVRMVLVRHGHAGTKEGWAGDDRLRPLDARGLRQAKHLVDVIVPLHPTRLISSPYTRCLADDGAHRHPDRSRDRRGRSPSPRTRATGDRSRPGPSRIGVRRAGWSCARMAR